MKKLKKRIYELFDVPAPDDRASKLFDVLIFCLIILNVAAVIFETTEYAEGLLSYFRAFEFVSVVVFTIEYVLRIWSITENTDYERPITGRLGYAFTPMLLFDLAAILPFYLPMIIPIDLRFLRILRLVRVFRVFKLARYVDDLQIMIKVLKDKREELFITLFVGFILLLIASSMMFYAENEAQPDAFSSIPAAMWWGVCTMTTVGYGDIAPVTTLGRFIASFVAVMGIGMFALPAGILGSGFMEEFSKRGETKTCPHCGKEIE